jgi:hypothetical protein
MMQVPPKRFVRFDLELLPIKLIPYAVSKL